MLCRCFLGAKLAREGKSGDPYHFLSLTPILSGLVNSVDSRGNLQCHYEQAVSNSIIPQLESSSIYRNVQFHLSPSDYLVMTSLHSAEE
jgi:hypothetical protein